MSPFAPAITVPCLVMLLAVATGCAARPPAEVGAPLRANACQPGSDVGSGDPSGAQCISEVQGASSPSATAHPPPQQIE
jgi:hypothetical protein